MTPDPRKVFTDSDMEKLKRAMTIEGPSMAVCFRGMKVEEHDISALIDRLEAAENVIKTSDAYNDFDCSHYPEEMCKCGNVQDRLSKDCHCAEDLWLKISGKDREAGG